MYLYNSLWRFLSVEIEFTVGSGKHMWAPVPRSSAHREREETGETFHLQSVGNHCKLFTAVLLIRRVPRTPRRAVLCSLSQITAGTALHQGTHFVTQTNWFLCFWKEKAETQPGKVLEQLRGNQGCHWLHVNTTNALTKVWQTNGSSHYPHFRRSSEATDVFL